MVGGIFGTITLRRKNELRPLFFSFSCPSLRRRPETSSKVRSRIRQNAGAVAGGPHSGECDFGEVISGRRLMAEASFL
jgi:hypothetical protein